MGVLSKIKNLYAYEDGDVITPRMGVQIANGFGLHQYYDPDTKNVINTDFSDHPATLFPQPYSSKMARVVVPSSGGQWYYNNIADNTGILDSDGEVKTAFEDLFETTTVNVNGNVFPALKIIGNLVDATRNDFTDKYIYYVGAYNGKQFTCQQMIPVQAAVENAYTVLLSVEGADGSGDETLSNDNDWIKYTAYLQISGETQPGATYTFQHLVNNSWVNVTNQSGLTEVGTNSLKLFDAAVEGTELYRVKVVYNNKTYYKTMEPTDEHDPYYIDDGCSILGDSVKPGDSISFNPKVRNRTDGTDVTTRDGWTFAYTLVKRIDGTTISGLNVSGLTYDVINQYGGVSVRIEATKS